MKPAEKTLTINGDVYTKVKDEDYLFVSFYRNETLQRYVRVEHSNFYRTWVIHLGGNQILWVNDLTTPMFCNPAHIPTYFTPEQNTALDILLTETLLKIK